MEGAVKQPPRMDVGCTIRATQSGAGVGESKLLIEGQQYVILDFKWKGVGSSGMLGVYTLQNIRGGRKFKTSWLRAVVTRLPPRECPGCGTMVAPNADGGYTGRHGSIGWSCDGKTKSVT